MSYTKGTSFTHYLHSMQTDIQTLEFLELYSIVGSVNIKENKKAQQNKKNKLDVRCCYGFI